MGSPAWAEKRGCRREGGGIQAGGGEMRRKEEEVVSGARMKTTVNCTNTVPIVTHEDVH